MTTNILPTIDERLKKGTLPHALLFTGTRLDVLKEKAKQLAVVLNAEGGAYPVDPDGKSQTIRIGAIRETQAKLHLKPPQGMTRVISVNEADAMNEEAQNALLKILEEPPQGVYFLLLTENPQGLAPTIRSRCQRFIFSSDAGHVAGEEALAAAWELIALAKTGDAVSIPEWDGDRSEQLALLDALLYIFRDIWVYRCVGNDGNRLWNGGSTASVREAAAKYSVDEIPDMLDAIAAARDAVDHSANFKLTMDALGIRLGIRWL